jgi:hypothetical protein
MDAIFARDGVAIPNINEMGMLVIVPGYSDPKTVAGEIKSATNEYNKIRLEIAQASSAAVKANGGRSLSALQVAQYHWAVFHDHGLPRTTFGGTPFTGTALDIPILKGAWCATCGTW